MTDAELIARCEAMAATKGGDFIPARRARGEYEVRIIVPKGADHDRASIEHDQAFFGYGHTPDDSMRDLLSRYG